MPDLLGRLERLRGSEKTVGEVGPTLMNWVSVSMETKRRPREKKRKGQSPTSLSPVSVFTLLCSSVNRSHGVQSYVILLPVPHRSFRAWRPTLHTAVTRWGLKPCWTRRSTRKEWRSFCACVRSLRSAGNWTCGTSWISPGAV